MGWAGSYTHALPILIVTLFHLSYLVDANRKKGTLHITGEHFNKSEDVDD